MVSSVGGVSSYSYASIRQTQQNPQERFAASDTDGSNSLSLEEYSNFAPDFVLDIESSFNEIDYDGNGELTDSELSTFAQSQSSQGASEGVSGAPPGGPPPPPPGGGASGTEESTSLIEELLSSASEEDSEIFDILDTDEDGEVSDEELKAGAQQVMNEFMNSLLAAQEEYAAA